VNPFNQINQTGQARLIKPYGDRTGDGQVQTSFTLPMPASEEARVAAQMVAERMGLQNVSVNHMEAIDPNFTFFVVYGSVSFEINISEIVVPKLDYPLYDFDQINNLLQKTVGRKIVVIGACIGSDAHTVGIDAIFNMKGYLGDYGLEAYSAFQAMNLRAQVDTKDLAKKVAELKANVVLVSRVVTQRDEHITELKKFLVDLSQTEGVPSNLIKICGGPRINHTIASEIGYDAGFGPGTKPGQVASYIADVVLKQSSASGSNT